MEIAARVVNHTMSLTIKNLPSPLVDKLTQEYIEIKKRHTMRDWGPSQLNGGRFAEAMCRIFQHLLGVAVTSFGTDIPGHEKQKIFNKVQSHPTIDDHIRQKVTNLTRLLLDFRNSRDAGHLGGFDANSMDTLFVTTASTWIVCELLRVYGGYSMPEAQKVVEGLAVKEYPIMMEFEDEIFITKANLSAKQEVLILLNKYPKARADFLFSKTRDNNSSRFGKMLGGMVSQKLIGQKAGDYFLMPRGMETILKESLLSYA